ncbi:MAG: ATP-binding cassette domain-containing protein, partial [Actinomycetia bacterium]|nr:ATP-binding cassette domain-containing protein [Actinomycetes bacterium]
PAITDPPAPAPIPDGPVALELDHVRFGYSRAHPVLDDVSLRVEPGETLAVVGGSGSGKSTIALLAPRFYDVQAGAVRVGGVDVRDAALADLRSRMGVVFEDSFLFSDTIAANIAFGRPDASAEQIRAAARAAEADRFIAELPDGYETVVGERGMTLSGGQRQRIALARALLIDPWLLLLDDATSAVDSRVEAEINATLRRVMRGRTTLLIAHRRSSLELADRIAVLDAGRVVDVGGYAELMARSAQFRRLLAGSGDDAEGAGASSPLGGLGADHRPDPGTGAESAGASSPLAGLGANHRPDPGTGAKGTGAKGTGACGPPAAEAADATGVTASAWPPDAPREPAHGSFGRTAATPALLARVAALPPAQDEPDVADAIARAPDPSFGLRRLLRPVRAVLTVGLVLVGVDAVAQLVVPALIRTGIDRGVTGRSLRILVALSLIALIVLLADWAIQHTGLRVTGRTGERLLYTLRVKTFAHLQRLGLDYYERELAGRIITRMTTDVDALSNFLQTGLATMLVSLLTLFGVLVALILLDAGLSLVLVAILPVLVAATWLFRHVSVPNYQLARDRISLVNAQFQENVAGVRVTQAMGREGHNAEQFARSAMAYRNTRMRSQIYISVYFPFVQFLADLAAALVLAIGATRLRDGTLTAGSLIAYFLYLDSFFSPVQQLSQVFDGYQQSAVGLSRLRELLRTPTTTPPPAAPVDPGRRLRGEIDLRAIRFAYSGAASEAIAGLDLRVAPGETIALVGETGAGKSTVVKLIARFYDPTSGGVLVDGRDLRRFDLPAYRHRLGVVPQEAYLSPGTVRDAIAYGQPDASDAQVEAAARSVSAHDMIAGLPLGYLRQVGERGRNLSAGQRQLVALARAALVDPDILLLDEATASLDLASELAVTRATEALSRRRTTVVVAHRLSTAARADRIIVMDRGRIVEAGPHAELFAAGGAYRALWDAYTGAQQSA